MRTILRLMLGGLILATSFMAATPAGAATRVTSTTSTMPATYGACYPCGHTMDITAHDAFLSMQRELARIRHLVAVSLRPARVCTPPPVVVPRPLPILPLSMASAVRVQLPLQQPFTHRIAPVMSPVVPHVVCDSVSISVEPAPEPAEASGASPEP